MKKKKIIILTISVAAIISVLIGYLLWAYHRADYYAQVSRETEDTQAKILDLEKSIQLWSKTENILALSDLYISIGRNDLAEKIMMGRGEVEILNKLGNLYLAENNVQDAEKAFIKAKNKKINSDSLKGLILVELKRGDRGVAVNYLNQLNNLDSDSASCYASFIYLNDFTRAKNSYKKAKMCNLNDLDKYFSTYNEAQSPLYLRLQAVNLYYSDNYLNIAEKDILALINEKDNYHDAHILASKIYEKMGDQARSDEHKQRTNQIDPSSSNY